VIATALALALAEPAPAVTAGLYRTHQMEVGSELLLQPDGTFRYSLDYGAVSEAAQGHWRARDGAVQLDSEPISIDVLRNIERTDAAFHGERLPVDGGALILQRWDTVFTFYRDDE